MNSIPQIESTHVSDLLNSSFASKSEVVLKEILTAVSDEQAIIRANISWNNKALFIIVYFIHRTVADNQRARSFPRLHGPSRETA